MLKKFAIIFIVLLTIINTSGCGSDKNAKEQAKTMLTLINVCQEETNKTELEKQQEKFTQFYSAENKISYSSSSYDSSDITNNTPQNIINNNDSQASDVYKNMEGYPTIYGIMSANNGVIINGNVALYGGIYTQENIKMANGAYAIINNSYIDKMVTYPKKYNSDVFLKDTSSKVNIPTKPVNMYYVKRKIKLINISEEE